MKNLITLKNESHIHIPLFNLFGKMVIQIYFLFPLEIFI